MGNNSSCCREEQLACIEQAVFDDTDEEDEEDDEFVDLPSSQLLAALEKDRQENASRAAEDSKKGMEARFDEMGTLKFVPGFS